MFLLKYEISIIRNCIMENIYQELFETEQAIKDLYAKSAEVRAGISIKYLKYRLNEYLSESRCAT